MNFFSSGKSAEIKICILFLTLFFSVVTFKTFAQGNLLLNSGFESPALQFPTASQILVSGDRLGPWTTGLGSTRLQKNSAWTFSEGIQGLELLGMINYYGGMPTNGTSFRLSFDISSNPLAYEGGQDTLSVIIRGQNIFYEDLNLGYFSAPFVSFGSVLQWASYTIDFTTISPNSTLSFSGTSYSSDGYGPIIDNVQLTIAPVPEPTSWGILGLGLPTIILFRYWNKAKIH